MSTLTIVKYFPYKAREGQEELIALIQEATERGRNVCIHAPTGFGKTPAVLAALLPIYLKEERRGGIIWAVRTGNETDRPIEELRVICEHVNEGIFGLSFRGKADMCLQAKKLGIKGYEAVSNLCKLKKKECPFYKRTKLRNDMLEGGPLLFTDILELAATENMCPYYLQLELLRHAKVVSLSYNYVLSPMGWVVRRRFPFTFSTLVVDEAHNLTDAVRNLHSDRISTETVRRAIREIEEFGRFAPKEVKEVLERLSRVLDGLSLATEEESTFYPLDIIRDSGIKTKHLKVMLSLGSKIQASRVEEGKAPRSSLHHLARFFMLALDRLGTNGIAYISSKEKSRLYLEIWDMRSAELLSEVWGEFRNCIFMSGTLTPIEAFAEMSGVPDCIGKVFPSPADLNKIRSFILTGLSTKGEVLDEDTIRKYAMAIRAFLERVKGNVAIFTASYRIQNDLMPDILDCAIDCERELFVEKEGMKGEEARNLLLSFKKAGGRGVLVAPVRGRFAEGADFPGEELVGAFVVGVPFARLTLRTKLDVEYNQKIYGQRKGIYYAYIVPAMRMASQALGRVIRSSEDYGTFVLGDERFLRPELVRLLPDFIRQTTKVVSYLKLGEALKSDFNT
ncbi:MAG: hypothetical protein DRN92_03460 [Thermoproteota archaeon]|nr:MAG: hypothetical protein DRN92_03460 [Candidatus Korarchaeota archaeon]